MKLNVGMYARLKNEVDQTVVIQQIAEIDKDTILTLNENIYSGEYIKENILKSSYDILDLLEPMDLIYTDISPDDCGGIVVPIIAETEQELEKCKEKIASEVWHLKAIITKEQFNSMKYIVGDDK